MLAYALIAGILFGLYFSLVGIGLNLVFGVMRIVNLGGRNTRLQWELELP